MKLKLTPRSMIFYEVDYTDINQLPYGMQVLKKGAHGGYFIHEVGYDNITYSPGAQYFLFKAPQLPEVQYSSAVASEINN